MTSAMCAITDGPALVQTCIKVILRLEKRLVSSGEIQMSDELKFSTANLLGFEIDGF